MSISTTQKRLYIVETAPPRQRLEIQFMPENISWDRTADIPSIAVVGRNNPHYQLTGGEDKLSFRLDFYADREDRTDVIQKVRWLQSLLYNDGYRAGARTVRIIWGNLFQKEVWVLKQAKADLSQFMPNANMLPQQAYVDLSFVLDTPSNLTIRDVRR